MTVSRVGNDVSNIDNDSNDNDDSNNTTEWFKYDLDRSTMQPTVNTTRVRSWPQDHDSTFHVTEMML